MAGNYSIQLQVLRWQRAAKTDTTGGVKCLSYEHQDSTASMGKCPLIYTMTDFQFLRLYYGTSIRGALTASVWDPEGRLRRCWSRARERC